MTNTELAEGMQIALAIVIVLLVVGAGVFIVWVTRLWMGKDEPHHLKNGNPDALT